MGLVRCLDGGSEGEAPGVRCRTFAVLSLGLLVSLGAGWYRGVPRVSERG